MNESPSTFASFFCNDSGAVYSDEVFGVDFLRGWDRLKLKRRGCVSIQIVLVPPDRVSSEGITKIVLGPDDVITSKSASFRA